MKKQVFVAVSVLSAWMAEASPYDSNSVPLVITGSMMTPVLSGGSAISIGGAGAAWSMDLTGSGAEGYAYTTFEIAPFTRVQITGGSLQNTITDGGEGWYFGDLVMFASAVNPSAAIAGKVPGPTGSNPAPGVMAWISDAQYKAAGYKTSTKAVVNSAGYRYYGGFDGYGSYLAAIGQYSSNVENFKDGGLAINGGAYAGWNQASSPSMASGTPARPLTDMLYPAGGGLNRPLKDQSYAFAGAVYSGAGSMYVTVMVRGGGGGSGSILVNNLAVSFSAHGALKITGSMMTPVLSSGTSCTVNGTGSAWSLDMAGSDEAEGYAYTTFVVAPHTKVQIAGGALQNTITGSWYFGDLVMFASAVNPSAAIAGKVPGPTGSNPAPGVMAWISDAQYKAAGYKTSTKAAVNSAGYRYYGGSDGYGSYRAAIGQYSSNVENFWDGGLAINGGAYAGWNQASSPSMASGTPARPLAEILYPAGGGLNRPVKDQSYAFDGAVYSGASNMFVTVMVRGGGCSSGSVLVDNLTLSLSTPGYLPALDMTRQGANVQLSWPANAPGLRVMQADALQTSNTVWTAVTNEPLQQGEAWTLQRPVEPGSRFYRLRMN